MKLLLSLIMGTLAATAFANLARAEVTFPYKTIVINCANEDQKIVLSWDFSLSPFINSVEVNGVEEAPGMTIQMDSSSKSATYAKEGVFSITMDGTSETENQKFQASASIQGKPISMKCDTISKWHLSK